MQRTIGREPANGRKARKPIRFFRDGATVEVYIPDRHIKKYHKDAQAVNALAYGYEIMRLGQWI